jgi:hypothetical protein
MVLTTAEKWRRRRRRVEMTTTTTMTGEDDDAERKSEQAVSRLAPATGTVADSFSLGGPSLSSGIRAAKDYPFSTTGPSSKILT